MRVKIKVCCIASAEEAHMAIQAGADAIGLVAKMPSGPGPIADKDIQAIAAEIPPPISTFMLTSETTADAIHAHVQLTQPVAVQIVHHIDPRESEALAKITHVRRVQVIHVEDKSALDLIGVYAPYVHAFLLDSGRPSAAIPTLGGTGNTHDWGISRAFVKASPIPVFLAGGLHADNIRSAIQKVRPYGVDLCSGVRTEGRLDPVKLQRFIEAVNA